MLGVAAPVLVAARPPEASIGVMALEELAPLVIKRVVEAASELATLLA